MRAYFNDKHCGDIDGLRQELQEFKSDFARIGSNLNQLALYFNIHDDIKTRELEKVHSELQNHFSEVMTLILEVQKAIRHE